MKIYYYGKFAVWNCKKCGAQIGSAMFEGERIEPEKYSSEEVVIRTKCPVCSTLNDIPVDKFKAPDV